MSEKTRKHFNHFYERNGGTIVQRIDEEKINTKLFNLPNGIKLSVARTDRMHPLYGNVLTQLYTELFGPYVKRSTLFFADGMYWQHAKSIFQLFRNAVRPGRPKYLQLKVAKKQVEKSEQFKMIPSALLYTCKGDKKLWSYKKKYFLFYGILPLDMNQRGFKFVDNQSAKKLILSTIYRFYNFGWTGKITAFAPKFDAEYRKGLRALGFKNVSYPTTPGYLRYILSKKSHLQICTNPKLPRKKAKEAKTK